MKLATVLITLLMVALISPTYARRYTDAELATMFVSREAPYYPLALRQRAITGSGTFRLYIDEQGRVTKIGVLTSTGNKELDASALKALVHWRAKPGTKREVDQPVTFARAR
jgi:TonB family protein